MLSELVEKLLHNDKLLGHMTIFSYDVIRKKHLPVKNLSPATYIHRAGVNISSFQEKYFDTSEACNLYPETISLLVPRLIFLPAVLLVTTFGYWI